MAPGGVGAHSAAVLASLWFGAMLCGCNTESTANTSTLGMSERLVVVNGCANEPIWIYSSANVGGVRSVKIEPGQRYGFQIPDSGLASTRFRPKMGCDADGNNCELGESGGPGDVCDPATGGCAPPVDSKFEASFGAIGKQGALDWWDTSAVDGYTLPYKVEVDGACPRGTNIDCSALSLSDCPSEEHVGLAGTLDLTLRNPKTQRVVGCYSPCSKITMNNWNNKVGSHSTGDTVAAPFCCPTPPESPQSCRQGPVVSTNFVKLIHAKCPNVYGYSYDDGAGLQTCPAGTKYTWTVLCPSTLPAAVVV